MPRYALKIEYDGQPFAGWQRQRHLMSVQQAVEEALAKLEPDMPGLTAAGRTDAGVHATGQVAHVDITRTVTPFRLSEALNHHLRAHPVAILAVAEVDDEFSARFSAVERQYLFRLISRRAPLTTDRGHAWQVKQKLDLAAMRAGAAHLIGQHDFTTFRSTMCQAKSPVKTLDELSIEAFEVPHGTEYRFTVRARSFLHHQVRSFVGTLERVGAGSRTPDDVRAALQARDRAKCGPVCPADGLYLTHVRYDRDVFNTD